jgi:hypothetical protein
MADEEKRKIISDMEMQGFPIEIKTSEILEAHGWEVTNQASYLDSQLKKSRTIDIIAEKNVILKSKLGFDIWLCIECKKAKNPWVFCAKDLDLTKEEFRRKVVSSAHFSENEQSHKKGLLGLVMREFLLEILYPQSGLKLAYNSFEPFTEGKNLSIHKARMQVCNLILDLDKNVSIGTLSRVSEPYCVLYLPMIVIGNQLYRYENDQLVSTDGLYYCFSYRHSSFISEVVTTESFEKHLNNLEHSMLKFKTQNHDK